MVIERRVLPTRPQTALTTAAQRHDTGREKMSTMPKEAVEATLSWLAERRQEAIEVMPKSEGGDIGALCRNVEAGLRDLYELLGADGPSP